VPLRSPCATPKLKKFVFHPTNNGALGSLKFRNRPYFIVQIIDPGVIIGYLFLNKLKYNHGSLSSDPRNSITQSAKSTNSNQYLYTMKKTTEIEVYELKRPNPQDDRYTLRDSIND